MSSLVAAGAAAGAERNGTEQKRREENRTEQSTAEQNRGTGWASLWRLFASEWFQTSSEFGPTAAPVSVAREVRRLAPGKSCENGVPVVMEP